MANDSLENSNAARTYESAVDDGHYQRNAGGLYGKNDNVRRYWEDQITSNAVRCFVEPLVARSRKSGSLIRVLDMGAGSGEGYEVLSGLKKTNSDLVSREIDVLPSEMIGQYKGVDLCEGMVAQGNEIYRNDSNVAFAVADLSEGLRSVRAERPFDIYFSLYGSLSHLTDEEMVRLISDISEHFEGECVFVADLLGRYSYEWPCYWKGTPGTKMHPYSMSYLVPPEAREDMEAERFPLRYWSAEEFDGLVSKVAGIKGVRVSRRQIWDRSICVGRHMDTGEFNPHAPAIRATVNHLHEFNVRTDLNALFFDYEPHPDFPCVNQFFERFQTDWNTVVRAAVEALEHWDEPEWLRRPPDSEYSEVVQEAIQTIRKVVENVKWFRMGDPRANVVEPQLGYILRNLETDLQEGMGVGHGLLALFELEKF